MRIAKVVAGLFAAAGSVSLALSCNVEEGGAPLCTDECAKTGVFGCVSEEVLVVCANFDADPCLEWGGFIACEPDETCIDGDCVGGCEDECADTSQQMCEGDGWRACGHDYDADPCLEWGDVVSCPAGESCSNGACSGSCSDECAEGEQACEGDGFKSCGQHDADACRDWSAIEPCNEGETCQGGACQPSQCLEEGEDCECGANQCCEGHCCPFFFICVSWSPDDDVCF